MPRKRKSSKRSRAAKLGWRRKRKNKNPTRKRRKTRTRRKTPRKRRRRRRNYAAGYGAISAKAGKKYARKYRTKKSRSYAAKKAARTRAAKKAARSRAAKKAARTRKRRKPVARKRKKRTYRRKKKAGGRRRKRTYRRRKRKYPSRKRSRRSRSAAAKFGWRRRRHDKSYRTRKGRKYKRTRGRRRKPGRKRGRGAFYYPRYRNPKLKDLAVPLLLGAVGFIGASIVINKMPATVTSKLPAGTASVILPLAAGLATMLFVAKKVPAKWKTHVLGIGSGMALAGVVAALHQYVIPKLPAGAKAAIGMSGYVRRPVGMGGYTVAPFMSGYVPARAGGSLGQMEEHTPKTLGAPVVVRGGQKLLAPPFKSALGYQSQAQKPYGLGLPVEERRYNRFTWFGVYDQGAYE
jgi:hypothetical protein